jgi:hypothetical protein
LLSDIEFHRPIEFPGQVVCVGINYGNRDAEYGNSIKGDYPNIFLRTPETLAAYNQAILVPPESEQLDYEGEIALVIGKGGAAHSARKGTGTHRCGHLSERRLHSQLDAPRQAQHHAKARISIAADRSARGWSPPTNSAAASTICG